MAAATLKPEQMKTLKEAIKRSWELVKEMKSLGVEMPGLVDRLETLEKAVETGKDVAKAAEEAQKSLEQYTTQLNRLCDTAPDDGDAMICKAKVARQYQRRSVQFTLNANNPNSVVRNFIKIRLRKLLPERICRMLESCRQ